MFTRILTTLMIVALAAVAGCADSPDPDEDMTFGDDRERLSEGIEAQLERIEDLMGDVGATGDDASAYDETRKVELENMRDELREDMTALQEATRQTWKDTAAEVERRLNDVTQRLDTMIESRQ